MSFHTAATPEDLPDWEWEDERRAIDRRSQEGADTELTDWLGGRQPVLDGLEEERDAEYQRRVSK